MPASRPIWNRRRFLAATLPAVLGGRLSLGAAHARLLLRTLLLKCVERVGGITVLAAQERVEKETRYERVLGYESLTLRLAPR